jgi:hypothetical protein
MYYSLSAFSHKNAIDKEEPNELDRDIVGDDVRGAVRHLHRPKMVFYRYTSYNDLTPTERKYIRKIGYLSLLNLINPILTGRANIKFNHNLSGGGSLGYIMTPFGDMIEENFWLNYLNKYKFHTFLRQYGNQERRFWSGGFSIHNYLLLPNLSTTVITQIWQQPKELSFNATKSFFGGSSELQVSYRILGKNDSPLEWWSFDIKIRSKSEGYIPEDPSLKKAFNLGFGFTMCSK